jgi:hypothetical protein
MIQLYNVLAPALGLGDFNPPLHGSVPGKGVPAGGVKFTPDLHSKYTPS